jgi:hypothetical protein
LPLPVRCENDQPAPGYDPLMTTKLTKTIRRELEIDGEPYTLMVSPDGVRLTRKRFRSGRALSWRAFLAGEAGQPAETTDEG